jgi:hypothetical protein
VRALSGSVGSDIRCRRMEACPTSETHEVNRQGGALNQPDCKIHAKASKHRGEMARVVPSRAIKQEVTRDGAMMCCDVAVAGGMNFACEGKSALPMASTAQQRTSATASTARTVTTTGTAVPFCGGCCVTGG